MIYRATEIIGDVRLAIDQNRHDQRLLPEEDEATLDLDTLIRSKIEEAAREVGMAAPAHLLGAGHRLDEAVYRRPDGSGYLILPEDFMRLISFRMSDWERSVHTAIGVDDPLYGVQSSRYRGLRGNPQKPVVAVTLKPEGRVLEFWSSKDDDAWPVEAGYLPWPRLDHGGGIDISERCYGAVVNKTAALVAATLGAGELSSWLEERTKQNLGI